jgi:NhaP-type Na+/H+ and K+/H+ antiporter
MSGDAHLILVAGLLDLVFFAVLVSTLLQRATVELVARRLGLSGDDG